jgi:hypothetical protein
VFLVRTRRLLAPTTSLTLERVGWRAMNPDT